jgi:hypothetical protein
MHHNFHRQKHPQGECITTLSFGVARAFQRVEQKTNLPTSSRAGKRVPLGLRPQARSVMPSDPTL